MTAIKYFNNQFLIAMPNMAEPTFFKTVSYLCQHNEEGALAIVINRPTGMILGEVLEQMGINTNSEKVKNSLVFAGGPVQQERGFIIHSKDSGTWDSSIPVSETTLLTSSRDILEAIAEDKGPEKYLVALGYAGWGAGQLENEIINNAWLNSPFQENILYQTPVENRWTSAANDLGIDINQMTVPAGHA